jgi:hypothetical protein
VLLGALAGSPASLAAERLIVALDPPTMETNRFSGTDGATGLLSACSPSESCHTRAAWDRLPNRTMPSRSTRRQTSQSGEVG